MSTIGYESWAVDLAEVGAIYPFQGSEGIMVLLAIAFWLGWHIVQLVGEKREITSEDENHVSESERNQSIDRY